MSEWTGTVKTISDRDYQGTKLWSFQIEESGRWFRMGKKEPPFRVGDTVCFNERNSQVEWSTIGVGLSAAASPVTEPTPSSAPDVGARIRYQAARADATRLIVAAMTVKDAAGKDALPWASNIAKGKRLDLLLGYVQQVTNTLLEQERAHEEK
jgi:hypothetical protein